MSIFRETPHQFHVSIGLHRDRQFLWVQWHHRNEPDRSPIIRNERVKRHVMPQEEAIEL